MFLEKKLCCCHFPIQNCQKAYISIRPSTSDFANKMSPIPLTKIDLFFNKIDTGYVCILEGMHEENITKSTFFWLLRAQ